MTELQTAFTILHLFEQLYTSAIVPDDAEPTIGIYDFAHVMMWQQLQKMEDGPRVLTVDKLKNVTPIVMMALQMFAFNTMCAHPDYDDFVARGAFDLDEDSDVEEVAIEEPALLTFATAEEYIQYDVNQKLDYYRDHQRRMPETLPDPACFPNNEVYNEAIAGRKVLCSKATHEGSRILNPGQFYTTGKRLCIECQRRAMRKTRNTYPSATAWETAHPTTNPKPKEIEFPSPVEYENALVIHRARRAAYKKAKNAEARKRDRNA